MPTCAAYKKIIVDPASSQGETRRMSSDDPLDLLDPERLRALAGHLASMFRYKQAADVLEKIEPRTEADDVLLARCLRHDCKPREATAVLKAHLLVEQPHPDTLTEAAMLLLSDDRKQAEALFRRALAIDAAHVGALHGLAWVLEVRTRNRPASAQRIEAHALLLRALEIDPDDPQTLQTRAVALLEDGDAEAAYPLFVRVVELRSRPPACDTAYAFEAHGNLACVLVALGRLDEALDAVEAAAIAGPDWRHANYRQALRWNEDLAPLRENLRFVMLTETSPDWATHDERLALAQSILDRRNQPKLEPRDVECFVEALSSGDRFRQVEALEAMAEMSRIREGDLDHPSTDEEECMARDGPPTDRVLARPELLRALITTDDLRVRQALAEFLAPLVASVHHPNVGRIARPLVVAGLEHWLDDDIGCIEQLLIALGHEAPGRVPQAADLLARALDEGLSATNFVAIVDALGAQGTKRHSEVLRRFTSVDEDSMRAAVVRALCRLGDPLDDRARWLEDPAWEVRGAVLEARGEELVAHHRDAVLAEWRKRGPTTWAAWRVLAPKLDSDFVTEALTLLDDEEHALWAWDFLPGHTLTREQLSSLLSAPFRVHVQAVPQKLAVLLCSQGDTACGLPEITTSHIAPSHVDSLENYGAWRHVAGAIESVGYLGWQSWRAWILEQLPKADGWQTNTIAGALGGIGLPEDVPLLRRLFEISNVYTRSRAGLSLLLLGEPPDESLLGEQVRIELHTAWAVRRLTGRVPERMLEPIRARLREWPRWTPTEAEVVRRLLS